MIVTDQYPPMIGGVPTVTHGLAVDFANRGHQVWVVAPSQGSRNVRRLEHKVSVYRFSSIEWPTYKDLRIALMPFLSVYTLLKKIAPDIIHVHSPVVLGNIAQLLAGVLHKPVVATNHYLPINLSRSFTSHPRMGKHFSNIAYSYLVSFCNRCEYVTAPTTTALKLLHEHGLRVPAGVISNGIDLKKFTPGERSEEVRLRFNLPSGRPLALYVNRLNDEKRVDVLLDTATKMTGNGYIAIVGSGPAQAELRARAERLKIGDRVAFLGYVSDADLLALRRLADVFVIPSEAELQSLSTLEAMACGLPVIAANAYALPELAHHEENGFLFQPGNSDELAHHLDTLLGDASLRERMGAASLQIIARHDRSYVLDQWEILYHRLSTEFTQVQKKEYNQRESKVFSGGV